MDPPIKVNSYVLVDEQTKEVNKITMDEQPMPKTPMAKIFMIHLNALKAKLPKPTFETYNTHPSWLDTLFYHSIYMPSLRKLFEFELNPPSHNFFNFKPKPTPIYQKSLTWRERA